MLGVRWSPQAAEKEGNKISWNFLGNLCKTRDERPIVGDASILSANGVPSRKGGVVNGRMNKASNK